MVQVKDVTVAYVMIKTKKGEAEKVAKKVTDPEVNPLFVDVYRAVVVTGPYDVIATVRVSDNQALGNLVVNGIHGIEEVTETMTAVMASYYRAGEMQGEVDNGPP